MNGLEGGRGSCFPSLEARFVKGEFFCCIVTQSPPTFILSAQRMSVSPSAPSIYDLRAGFDVCVRVWKCVEVRAGMWACVVGGGG